MRACVRCVFPLGCPVESSWVNRGSLYIQCVSPKHVACTLEIKRTIFAVGTAVWQSVSQPARQPAARFVSQ